MTILANKKSREQLEKELALEDFSRITLSFYKYVHIKDLKNFREFLYIELGKIGVLGRIYVANEGINAQINVPEYNFDKLRDFVDSIEYFKDVPFKVAVEDKGKPSFIKLIVRIKDKIVADGIEDPNFNPADTGFYVNAEEMNDVIEDENTVVLDMRNSYEFEIGHFKNAHFIDVDTFKEQLSKLSDDLKDQKDKNIVMYCTGGIRCEKSSAYMKHKGFKNVAHLKGGIIEYAKEVKEKGLENKFKGKNFVFDERLGEMVGKETISNCHLCNKVKCDNYTHCKNQACHVLMISCLSCTEKLDNHCSKKCQIFNKLPRSVKKKYVKHSDKENIPQFFEKNRLRPKVRK